MKFIVNNLDKVKFYQTLYAHGDKKGMGQFVLESNMSVKEAEDLVLIEKSIKHDNGKLVVDYFKGVPLKVHIFKDCFGNLIVDTDDYDYCHGKYHFLLALLSVFELNEIVILSLSYNVPFESKITNQQKDLKNLLKSLIQKQKFNFKVFVFKDEAEFTPFFLREVLN